MFEHIHFFRSDITLVNKRIVDIDKITDQTDTEELNTKVTAFNSLLVNADYNVPGHTAILFPPLESHFSTKNSILPQGFYLCDHWKGYFTRRERYESFLLSYTMSGEGVLEYEGETYDMKESEFFFIDCREYQYYYTKGQSWQHVDVHFCGQAAEELYREFRRNGSPVCRDDNNHTLLQMMEKLATVWDTRKIYPTLYISNELAEILTQILLLSKREQLTDSQMDTFSYLIRYMENHFTEELNLDFLAELCSMSKYHFARMFKKYAGLSPIQYIIQLRVANAKNLLINSDMSIKEIAYSVGFRNINNFMKQFKNLEQMTPSEYRRQMQKK